MSLLKTHYAPGKKIMIFGLYKKEVGYLEKMLWDKGYDKVCALQGDMTQANREKAIDDFKAARLSPLIATDVASRGLDVNDVELVINYTFPLTIEDYVHRIGRTPEERARKVWRYASSALIRRVCKMKSPMLVISSKS